jgi:hypothetical protein
MMSRPDRVFPTGADSCLPRQTGSTAFMQRQGDGVHGGEWDLILIMINKYLKYIHKTIMRLRMDF